MDACDVLIVDDDAGVRNSLRYVLTDVLGLSVHEATSGEEGLARLARLRPRVILLDMGMPFLTGHDVLETMRRSLDLASIPVVRITGEEETTPPVLLKPFSIAGLRSALAPFLPELQPG